jgi:membrane protein implicated in regulation of membrane protease activity
MNKAYLIVGIPAFITSFCWLAFGWGWRFAVIVTSIELIVVLAAVMYFLRRRHPRPGGPEGSR